MLESLKLTFQVHEKTELELDPSITVLCGPSDSGKSSALRGLRWLCLGQAPHSPMAPWGTDKVRVALKVDGKKVERRKGKSENVYALDGKVFAAVGQGVVPDEVAKLLNVGPQNFQTQHSGHFFLADTPGEVARQLNGIVNLSLIDDSLAAAAGFVRDAKQAEALSRGRLEQAEARKAELAWADEANKVLLSLEQLNSRIESQRQEVAKLAQLVKDGQTAELTARTSQRACQAKETALQGLDALVLRHSYLFKEATQLAEMLETHKCQTTESMRAKAKADKFEADLRKRFKACPICRRPMPSSPS